MGLVPARAKPSAIDGPKPGPRQPRRTPKASDDPARRLRTGGATPNRLPDAAEARQHAAWGHLQTLRPAYAHLLDLGERGRGRTHAQEMVDKIVALLDRGGWTDSERVSLYAARNKWRRRAEGLDPRYLLTGGDVRGVLDPKAQHGVQVMRTVQAVLEDVQAVLRGDGEDAT